MKKAYSAIALAISVLSTPALAEVRQSVDTPTAAPNGARAFDPANLALAGKLVELMYPVSDTIDDTRKSVQMALELVENPTARTKLNVSYDTVLTQIEPIIVRNFPKIQQAYTMAYAEEFTSEELRDIISFASTPTGRHFLRDTTFADGNTLVTAASDEMMSELEPTLFEFQKTICKQAAEQRLAAGDKKAKCSMA